MKEEITDTTKLIMDDIGESLNDIFTNGTNKKYGFFLMVFPFEATPDDRANYVSNAKREDIIKVMAEFVAKHS